MLFIIVTIVHTALAQEALETNASCKQLLVSAGSAEVTQGTHQCHPFAV